MNIQICVDPANENKCQQYGIILKQGDPTLFITDKYGVRVASITSPGQGICDNKMNIGKWTSHLDEGKTYMIHVKENELVYESHKPISENGGVRKYDVRRTGILNVDPDLYIGLNVEGEGEKNQILRITNLSGDRNPICLNHEIPRLDDNTLRGIHSKDIRQYTLM